MGKSTLFKEAGYLKNKTSGTRKKDNDPRPKPKVYDGINGEIEINVQTFAAKSLQPPWQNQKIGFQSNDPMDFTIPLIVLLLMALLAFYKPAKLPN